MTRLLAKRSLLEGQDYIPTLVGVHITTMAGQSKVNTFSTEGRSNIRYGICEGEGAGR